MIRISVDAMGGDFGPEITIAGAAIAQKRFPEIRFIFYRSEERRVGKECIIRWSTYD